MYIWKLWYVCELWVPVKTYWCLWCSALFKYRLSALEWKVLKVSGGSAPASIDLPKDAVKCPLTIPPLSQMHYLPLVWCTFSPPDWDVLTPDLSSILCALPAQNSIQLHSLMSSFQTRRLSAVRMAEDNLEMGKGSAVGQIWDFDQNCSDRDWSRLIRLWEAKNRQWICENWREIWEEKNSFPFAFSKLKIYVLTKQV